MPVNMATALYFSKVSSKIIIGPGFTQVPWFDKVLLVPEIVDEKLIKNKKFIEVLKLLKFKLLKAKVNFKDLNEFKKKHFISNSDFVLGTFSRYEKILKNILI